ncbi:hypothetical protein PR002_g21252 [Phytophthora rubi]|uniref:Uncharacterized protein n=1 Tax=Phytophthora rubi TaxID=129364 RepID=A0A6A3J8M8_9STRA|nr:hypothetical protein PR002_g21252 [Phytophthora rubi]
MTIYANITGWDRALSVNQIRNLHSLAKQQMERIVAVLTKQSTPTFKSAFDFLDEFGKALHEGSFPEFAAGFPGHVVVNDETSVDESNITVTSTTSKSGVSKVMFNSQMQCNSKQRSSHLAKKDIQSAKRAHGAFFFSPPPKSPGLTYKQQQRLDRATKIRASRTAAKRLAESECPISFEDVQKLLSDGYSWSSARSTMDELKLKTCDVQGPVEVRLLQAGESMPAVTSLLDMGKIDEDKRSIPYDVDESRVYVAYWKEFGCISHDQLIVMERIIAVKNTLRDVGSTLDWIEDVNWKEGSLTAIGGPFNDEHMLSKAERKGAVMSMPLCTKYLNTEATSGASLLVYRQDMWLISTCMITAMMYMQRAYECVGIVNPAFYHSKSSADKISYLGVCIGMIFDVDHIITLTTRPPSRLA